MPKRYRPSLRLLFDELLPWRVAAALRVLEFNVSYVGNDDDGQPDRGSTDPVVLAHATATNQVVVTSNHDMVMLCAEQEQHVIWLDPRGRRFNRAALAALAFAGIAEWESRLASATSPVCLRVMRTKVEVLPLQRARHLAERRHKALTAKRAARRRVRPEAPGQIASTEGAA